MSMPIHPELRYRSKLTSRAPHVCASDVSEAQQETVGLVQLRMERLLARAACWMQHIEDDAAACSAS